MNKKKVLYWSPRILSITYIIFISLFALDVFEEGYGFPKIFFALLIHLIPSIILTICACVSWRKELFGGIAFMILGIAFTVFFKTYNNVLSLIFISGPVFIISILFFLSKHYSDKTLK
ncbi:hypothetical protein D6745_00250 [Candidatus Woesearchaeota archaeon]|nr:MAG: hypothetical protein D6745_00250 [Candidatus Woesearchaeota archaeon]